MKLSNVLIATGMKGKYKSFLIRVIYDVFDESDIF